MTIALLFSEATRQAIWEVLRDTSDERVIAFGVVGLTFGSTTGTLGLGVGFNRDNDFLNANESATRSASQRPTA